MKGRIAELESFLEENPNDPFLKYALTMEFKKLGETENTLLGFQNLVQDHPDYVGTYYHYGKLLEQLGNKEEAGAIYKRGMEVAQRLRNRHAYGELLGAYNLSQGIEDDDWDD
ncbi:tetratricopeptide repeat protein [Sphingobacterium sp. LRF_L2]|uniref:tetratricopeptide repeat protein n=1 Tax=Sphingobacterium sp. LRF_L2 TaxID=3369421 RepID=UPI003F61D68B